MRIDLRNDTPDDEIDVSRPIDISIPMRFNGPQPNAYGVDRAASEPVRADSLVGDTRQGGSVNFEQYKFIPHCNGTHTECVGHITDERISIRDCLTDVLIPALLVSVDAIPANTGGETFTESAAASDRIVTRAELRRKLDRFAAEQPAALVLRTLPNSDAKLTAEYGEGNIPPYFTADAMVLILALGFKHLLVDMPSIDRIFDKGRLINHRIFWNVKEGSNETNPETRLDSTITELIYVPNDVADGEYLLNLQIAPFESDCAPSRPVLLRKKIE